MHIEASFQRIQIDVHRFPDIDFLSPAMPARAFLNGDYTPIAAAGFGVTDHECAVAVTVAHEQRHYLDQCLTNHGSLLVRFWSQMKSALGPLIASDVEFPVPIRFGADPILGPGFPVLQSDEDLFKAVRLAARHNQIISHDHYTEARDIGGLSGGSQLEALATAFEAGPIEEIHGFGRWLRVSELIPRSLHRWRAGYLWPCHFFDPLGLGYPEGNDWPVAYTRLWPSVLVPALMGDYWDFTRATEASEPDLLNRVLPSRRLARLFEWLAERKGPLPTEPTDLWALVNNVACPELFGRTAVASMAMDVETNAQKVLERANSSVMTPPLAELMSHLGFRKRLLEILEQDPAGLIDPRAYWSNLNFDWPRMSADWMLYDANGFGDHGGDLVPCNRGPFSEQVDGRPRFLKPAMAVSGAAEFQELDEILTVLTRFLVCGKTSDSWVGPDRDWAAHEFEQSNRMRGIPPFA